MKRISAIGLAVLVALALGSCRDLFHGCTEMACFDGLLVIVTGSAGEEYEITVSDTAGASQSTDCVARSDGTCVWDFPGYHPTEITVLVSGGGVTATRTVQPEYVRSQPNGPGCSPICYRATVEMDLDEIGQTS